MSFVTCVACYHSHDADGMRKCPTCGHWLHTDCRCPDEECQEWLERSEAGEEIGRAETDKSATASTQSAQGEEGPARSESRCIDCGTLATLGRLCNRCFVMVKL